MKRTSMSFNAFRLTVIILIILSAVQENISIPSEVRIATLIPSTYNNDSTPMFTSGEVFMNKTYYSYFRLSKK